ncbi:MAG TPA: gas vesicle protein GvpO [Intrasporangium sp.]|uniref:gas vesicle protein GvpO n=1 Tax=Nocardioides sp. TaxID=35761 RepID=UPI002E65FA6F|nr:gas vesicle protein GvpO [Intrasporangium sp.]
MADDSGTRSGGGSSKKTAAKKTSKGTTKKAAKKSTTKATKKVSRNAADKSSSKRAAPRVEPSRRASGARIAEEAVRQLAELTTKHVEGVTGLHRDDDGWQVELEVLELQRVPTTTDVLAIYEVTLDSSGALEGYRRVRRYVRGQAEDGR